VGIGVVLVAFCLSTDVLHRLQYGEAMVSGDSSLYLLSLTSKVSSKLKDPVLAMMLLQWALVMPHTAALGC
jgi:hypothetical protein